jgi:hypothetical protein
MKDLCNTIDVVSVLDPIDITATSYKEDIDLAGCNAATLLIACGLDAGTGLSSSHKFAFKLEHADDDGTGSADSYAACTDADVLGFEDLSSGVFFTLDSTDEDNAIYKIGYVGGKRFLKITYTVTGTVSMPMGITLVKGALLDVPPIS